MTTTYTTEYDETFTITHRVGRYSENDDLMNIFEAHDEEGALTTSLYTNIETGQIMQVETRKENRGEGIATAVAQYAVDSGFELFHSPEEHCTEKGLDFARRADFIDVIDPELAYQPEN